MTENLNLKCPEKCPEVPRGNTRDPGQNTSSSKNRVRFFPSFTSFLVTEPVWDDKKMKYLIYGKEICPTTQKQHWQGAVYFFDKVSLKQAQKILQIGNSHMETVVKDSEAGAVEYCKKDGDFKEFGIKPKQGKRNDLECVADLIIKQELTVDDLVVENPMLYHQYGRTLHKLEDIALRKKWRTEMTEGIWYVGKTGTGKSHIAFEGFTPETHYSLPNDNGWWDGYTGQDTLIINDFRGHIPYNELLQIVDKWPYNVRRRCREPAPFISKRVIVTSSLSPEQVYNKRNDEDKIEQLLRRFTVIQV